MTEVDVGALDEIDGTAAPPEAGRATEMSVVEEASNPLARSWQMIARMTSMKLSTEKSATWLPVGTREAGSWIALGDGPERPDRELRRW